MPLVPVFSCKYLSFREKTTFAGAVWLPDKGLSQKSEGFDGVKKGSGDVPGGAVKRALPRPVNVYRVGGTAKRGLDPHL